MLTEIVAAIIPGIILSKQAQGDAPAGTSNDGDDQAQQVPICNEAEMHRLPLTAVLARLASELSADQSQSLRAIANILRPANGKLEQKLAALEQNHPAVYARYLEIEANLVHENCNNPNDMNRLPLTTVMIALYNALSAEESQYLKEIANILKPANDKLTEKLHALEQNHPEIYARLQEIEANLVFTEQCGCQMFPVPAITSVTPAEITLGEQPVEVQMTITGANLPENAKVLFLLPAAADAPEPAVIEIGNSRYIADIAIPVPDSIEPSSDRTTLTLTVTVPPYAVSDSPETSEIENRRTVYVVSNQNEQLAAVLPDAFTVKRLSTEPTPQCNDRTDNDNDGLTDFTTGPNRDPGCANADDNNEIDPDPTCKNHIDDDRDGLVDMNDPDCVNGTSEPVAPPPTPTPIEHYLLEHQLAASILLGSGYYGNIPTNLRAGAETLGTPVALDINFGDEAHPITIIGRKNALGGDPGKWLELMGYAMFGYQYFMHLNGADDTHQVDLAAGLHPRAHIGPVFLDVYGGVNYQHNNYQYPNLLFYDGNNILGNVGLGIGSSFGTQGDWITAVLRGEYQNEWFDYSDFMFRGNPMSYPFRGNSQAGELGVDLTMAFADRYCAKTGTCWKPNLEMDLSFIFAPNGTIRTPGFIASTYGVTQDDLFGSEFAIALRFARGKYQPYASLSVSTLDLGIENDPEFWQMAFAAGANFEGHELALQLGGGQGWRRNLAVYGEGDLFFTTLSYTPPVLGGALSVTGRLDVVDSQVGGGGFLGFDFAKLGYWLYQRNHPQSSQ